MLIPNSIKKLAPFVVSAALVGIIYSRLDCADLSSLIHDTKPKYLAYFLLLFVPQLAIASWRWSWLVRALTSRHLPMKTAFGQLVGSYSANLLIPGKLGEFFRSFWLDIDDRLLSIYLVILEKILDITAIVIILVVAMAVELPWNLATLTSYKGLVWLGAVTLLVLLAMSLQQRRRLGRLLGLLLQKKFPMFDVQGLKRLSIPRGQLPGFLACSILLWLVQLYQFVVMFQILDAAVPIDSVYAGGALALLAATMPLTVGGIGARDAALLWYFKAFVNLEVILGMGMLCLLRVIIPGVIGIPFFFRYNTRKKRA